MIYLSEKYAYLFLCLPFVVLYFVILVYNNHHRRDQIKMTLFGALVGPIFEIFYFRDYWFPQSTFFVKIGSFPLMMEDVILGGAIAGIVSVLFDVLFEHDRYEVETVSSKPKRVLIVFLTFIFSLFLFLILDINSIYASSLAMIVSGFTVLYFRKDLYINASISAFGFAFILFLVAQIFMNLPANIESILKDIWLIHGTKLDVRYLKIPLSGILWAFSVGFFVGPLYKFVHNLGYYFENAGTFNR